MRTLGDEAADGGATRPCDSSNRVVAAAAWSGLLRTTLGTVLRGTYEPFLRRRDADHVSARDGEMPPGREDMDLCTDKVLSKGRILQELTKAVKLVSDRSPSGHPAPQGRLPVYTHLYAPHVMHRLRELCNCGSLCTFPLSRKHGCLPHLRSKSIEITSHLGRYVEKKSGKVWDL